MGYDGSLKFDTAIDTSGFNSGIQNLGSIAKGGLSILGGAIAGVTAAMGAGVSAAVNVGKSFETATSQLAATMGVTKGEISDLIDKAKELGRETSFSATEAAEGLNVLAQSGLSAEEQVASIGDVLNLAAAGTLSLADAASYTTGTIKGFQDSMDNAQYYTDLIAKGATLANTDVKSLGEALSNAAATAGNYGQAADSTTLSLLRLAEQNLVGSEAATALSRAMMDLYTPTESAQKVLDGLGVAVYDSSGNARDFNTVVDELNASLAGMSEQEANATKNAIFTTYGLQAFNKMTVSSTEKVNEFKDGLAHASDGIGSAAQQAETMLDNLEGQLTKMASAAEGLGIELYESIQQPLTDIAKAGTEAISELTKAFQEGGTDGLIEAGGKLIADLLTGIAGALPNVITTAVQIITSIIDSLSANTPQMLSAGIQILQALIDGMLQILPAVGGFILNLMTELYTQLSAHAPDLLQKGYEILSNLVDGFVQAIPEMLPKVLDFIQGIGEKLAEAAPVLIQKGFEILSKLVEGITTAIPILIAKVPEIITTFANIINDNFPTILAKGVELLGQLALGIVQAIPTLVAHIPDIIQAIVAVFTAYNWMALGKNIIQFLGNGIKSMVSAAVSATQSVQTGIINAIQNLPSTLSNLGKNAISGLGKAISGGISAVVSNAKNVVTGIKGAFTSINWGSIGSNIISGIANGIAGAVGGLVSAAINAAKSAFNAAKKALGIHSPSTLFRDEIGKNMALGMGIGFEKNVPTDDMEASLKNSVERMQYKAKNITSNPVNTTGQITPIVNNQKTNPMPDYPEFDYERMGKEVAKSIEGMGVYLEKKPVGQVIAPVINDELGRINRRKT